MIVDPRDPEPVAYDREFTYVLDERALDFTPAVALGDAQLRNREAGNGRGGELQYDQFLLNGKAGDAIVPLEIAPGERIRVRLVNAGSLPHAIHLHGHSFKIIATDGNPVPPLAQLVKDTVLIGPAERYDLEVEGTNAGIWMFHCHMPNHQDNGMMTAMVYDGFTLPAGAHDHH
jgi:FtsP/CotA-like multicopper oxidase with cupredoxin domain